LDSTAETGVPVACDLHGFPLDFMLIVVHAAVHLAADVPANLKANEGGEAGYINPRDQR
jgi:hypothetical protein